MIYQPSIIVGLFLKFLRPFKPKQDLWMHTFKMSLYSTSSIDLVILPRVLLFSETSYLSFSVSGYIIFSNVNWVWTQEIGSNMWHCSMSHIWEIHIHFPNMWHWSMSHVWEVYLTATFWQDFSQTCDIEQCYMFEPISSVQTQFTLGNMI